MGIAETGPVAAIVLIVLRPPGTRASRPQHPSTAPPNPHLHQTQLIRPISPIHQHPAPQFTHRSCTAHADGVRTWTSVLRAPATHTSTKTNSFVPYTNTPPPKSHPDPAQPMQLPNGRDVRPTTAPAPTSQNHRAEPSAQFFNCPTNTARQRAEFCQNSHLLRTGK